MFRFCTMQRNIFKCFKSSPKQNDCTDECSLVVAVEGSDRARPHTVLSGDKRDWPKALVNGCHWERPETRLAEGTSGYEVSTYNSICRTLWQLFNAFFSHTWESVSHAFGGGVQPPGTAPANSSQPSPLA